MSNLTIYKAVTYSIALNSMNSIISYSFLLPLLRPKLVILFLAFLKTGLHQMNPNGIYEKHFSCRKTS